MKTINFLKQALFALGMLTIISSCNTALSWEGIYHGTIPCADCEGIETVVILNADNTYMIKSKYLGKDMNIFEETGTIEIPSAGKLKLISQNSDNNPAKWIKVAKNKIIYLDLNGELITGPLASSYELTKINAPILEKRWNLTHLNGKEIQLSENSRRPYLVLNVIQNRAGGVGGCNNFFGSYQLTGENGITLSRMGATMMACPDMNTESEFFKALESVVKYGISGGTLSLMDKDNNTIMVLSEN